MDLRIGIFGSAACGKTVFATVLTDYLMREKPQGCWCEIDSEESREFVVSNISILDSGEWPPGTRKGERKLVSFSLKRQSGDDIESWPVRTYDIMGEEFDNLLRGKELDDNLNHLQKMMDESTGYIFLINPEGLLEEEGKKDRKGVSRGELFTYDRLRGWMVKRYNLGTRGKVRKPAAFVFSQMDLYREETGTPDDFAKKTLGGVYDQIKSRFACHRFFKITSTGDVVKKGKDTYPPVPRKPEGITEPLFWVIDQISGQEERRRRRMLRMAIRMGPCVTVAVLVLVLYILSQINMGLFEDAQEALARGDHQAAVDIVRKIGWPGPSRSEKEALLKKAYAAKLARYHGYWETALEQEYWATSLNEFSEMLGVLQADPMASTEENVAKVTSCLDKTTPEILSRAEHHAAKGDVETAVSLCAMLRNALEESMQECHRGLKGALKESAQECDRTVFSICSTRIESCEKRYPPGLYDAERYAQLLKANVKNQGYLAYARAELLIIEGAQLFADGQAGQTLVRFRVARDEIDSGGDALDKKYLDRTDALVRIADNAANNMRFIPGGRFPVGAADDPDALPLSSVHVGPFYIDRHEVTNEDFLKFIRANPGYVRKREGEGGFLQNWDKEQEPWEFREGCSGFPVTFVNWEDATKYARWLGKRLPAEIEWEKAAGWDGSTKRKYPWGNAYVKGRANTSGGCKAVGASPGDCSYFDVLDMAGNVTEWTASTFQRHPTLRKVVRGGYYRISPGEVQQKCMTTGRLNETADWTSPFIGFRCVRKAEIDFQTLTGY